MTRINTPSGALAGGSLVWVLLLAFLLALLGVLTACRAPPPPAGAATGTPAECPQRLRGQIRLTASAIPLSLPQVLATESGSARPQELVARRLLLAASPAAASAGAKISASTLAISVVGGTFGGSVSAASPGEDHTAVSPLPRELDRSRALEVIPGQLRIEPFFSSPHLKAQTLALDVTVVPGGTARSRPLTAVSPLWNALGEPVAPADTSLTVTTAAHLTTYSAVEAQVQLDVEGFDRRDSRYVPWQCSYEAHFTLVDHAVLPPLWTLQLALRGKPVRWLALLAPATGPFRAVFSDPAVAQSFASWLRATSATQAGGYQLGVFEADDRPEPSVLPADRDIARTFRPATSAELGMLTVRRLGED